MELSVLLLSALLALSSASLQDIVKNSIQLRKGKHTIRFMTYCIEIWITALCYTHSNT